MAWTRVSQDMDNLDAAALGRHQHVDGECFKRRTSAEQVVLVQAMDDLCKLHGGNQQRFWAEVVVVRNATQAKVEDNHRAVQHGGATERSSEQNHTILRPTALSSELS